MPSEGAVCLCSGEVPVHTAGARQEYQQRDREEALRCGDYVKVRRTCRVEALGYLLTNFYVNNYILTGSISQSKATVAGTNMGHGADIIHGSLRGKGADADR